MKDKEYEWLAIKGKDGGFFNSPHYVYIDDVNVTSTSACSHICTPKEDVSFLQIAGQPNVLATAMIGNTPATWGMLVLNAADIKFEVFNRWGASVYSYHAYDPNGLKDSGYADYAFVWNGNDNNGNIMQFGQYSFNLTMKNCRRQLVFQAEPLFIFPAQTLPILEPPFQANVLNNCCKPNATFNNITFQDGFREDVDDFINAGTGGATIVAANTSVDFYAGNNIVLGPGFQANGDFTAEIVPCGTFSLRMNRGRELPTQDEIDSLFAKGEEQLKQMNRGIVFDENVDTSKELLIYPNPAKDKISISLKNNEIIQNGFIEVYTLQGKLLFTKKVNSTISTIDATRYAKGAYFIKLTVNKTIYKQTFIKD